jgi:hypothetical protein
MIVTEPQYLGDSAALGHSSFRDDPNGSALCADPLAAPRNDDHPIAFSFSAAWAAK